MFTLLIQPWYSLLILTLFCGDVIQKTNLSVLIQNRSIGLMLNFTTTEIVAYELKAPTDYT